MRLTARILAVVLFLYPVLAKAQTVIGHDPGFIALALPEDPLAYAAGAGPAGGLGISAAAENPAAMAWGYSVQGRYSIPGMEDDVVRNASLSYLSPNSWGAGLSGSWYVPDKRYTFWPERGLIESYQYLLRLTVAARADSSLSYGISASYARSSHHRTYAYVDEWGRPWVASNQSLAQAWTIGLGLRLHGAWVLDPPKMERKGRSILIGNFRRPRWSAGLALLDLPITTTRDGTYWSDSLPPSRATVGFLLRPYHGPWFGVALGGSLTHWIGGHRSGEAALGLASYSFGTWRAGLSMDLAGIIETGFSVGGGYEDSDRRVCMYAAIGPPFIQLTLQTEGRKEVVYYSAHEGYTGYGVQEDNRLNQIAITVSWPFRYYRHERPPSAPSIY